MSSVTTVLTCAIADINSTDKIRNHDTSTIISLTKKYFYFKLNISLHVKNQSSHHRNKFQVVTISHDENIVMAKLAMKQYE